MKNIIVIVSSFFICLGAIISLLNIVIGYRIIQNEKQGIKKTISFIPVLSILFSSIAYYTGRSELGYWPLLPAVFDPATWMIIGLPWFLMTKCRKRVQ